MSVDVVLTPHGLSPSEVAGRTVFVVDILRATTTICAALHHGARAVIPVATSEEAVRLAQTIGSGDILLAGERDCEPIPGFPLGNSPREMTEEVVRGKTLVMTTTNGTKALLAAQGAAAIHPVAASNISVAAERARGALERGQAITVVCAGRRGEFALDDAYCAGRLVHAAVRGRARGHALNDAAIACLDLVRRYRGQWTRPLAASAGGRDLMRLGYREDLRDAARPDAYPVLAQFHERRVTVMPAAA